MTTLGDSLITNRFAAQTLFTEKHTLELADRLRHLFRRRVSKPQDKSLPTSLAEVRRGKRPKPKLLACRARRHLQITESFRQDDGEMHSSFRSMYFQSRTEFFLEPIDERTPAQRVKLAHAANVAREMPFIHEVREYCLEKVWRCNIHGVPYRSKTIDQILRDNDIAQS